MTDTEEVPDFTTNEELENFTIGQSSAEFVGFVTGIGSVIPWINKKDPSKQGKLFKFLLSNSFGNELHVIAWDDDVDRVMKDVEANQIMCLSGINVTSPKVPAFNKGTKPFELTIRSNTTFTTHGKYYPGNVQRIVPTVIFKNLLETTGYFKTEAYVKTAYAETSLAEGRTMIVGSLTDLTSMIESRLSTFKVANQDDNKLIEQGDKIELTGIVINGSPSYVMIQSLTDIVILQKKAITSKNQLRKGCNTLSKRKAEKIDNQQTPNKITKHNDTDAEMRIEK